MKSRKSFLKIAVIVAMTWFALEAASASAGKSYHLAGQYTIPGEGSWDYITVDSVARRMYVSFGADLHVLDEDSGRVVGVIPNTPGAHGAAIAPDLNRGFSSNGGDSSVNIFDTQTLAVIRKVHVNQPDFILNDGFTKRVFPIGPQITVLDARTGNKAGEVNVDGDLEKAVSDGNGAIYVSLVDKSAVAVIDAVELKLTATFPIEECTGPNSLSYDAANHRLFVGCQNGLAVLDTRTGKTVAHSLMCSGADGSAFDTENRLIFESCTEGVLSVIQQVSPNYYQLVDTVKTQLWARTMAFDARTKKIYLPTADIAVTANDDPKFRKYRINSFRILILEP